MTFVMVYEQAEIVHNCLTYSSLLIHFDFANIALPVCSGIENKTEYPPCPAFPILVLLLV
jgi:hypothetical protein